MIDQIRLVRIGVKAVRHNQHTAQAVLGLDHVKGGIIARVGTVIDTSEIDNPPFT